MFMTQFNPNWFCSNHQLNKIIKFCSNKICKETRLICSECETSNQLHVQHKDELINIKEFQRWHKYRQKLYDSIRVDFKEKLTCFQDTFQELNTIIDQKYLINLNKVQTLTNQQLNDSLQQFLGLEDLIIYLQNIISPFYDSTIQSIQMLINEINQNTVNSIYSTLNQKMQCQELLNSGYSLYQDGEFDKANDIFNQILNIDKENKESLFGIGEILRSVGNYKDAIIQYDKILDLDSQYKNAYYSKGESLKLLGNYEEAIIQFKNYLEFDLQYRKAKRETSLISFIYKGQNLTNIEKQLQSLTFTKTFNNDPKYKQTLWKQCLRLSGKYQESIQWYNDVISIEPKYKSYEFGSDQPIMMFKQQDEQNNQFYNSKFKEALFGIGESLKMMGRYQESIIWYNKSLDEDVEYKSALIGKGESLKKCGKFDESLPIFNLVLQQDSNNDQILILISDVLLLKKQYNDALIYINKALQINPNNQVAIKLLEQIQKEIIAE